MSERAVGAQGEDGGHRWRRKVDRNRERDVSFVGKHDTIVVAAGDQLGSC